MAIRMNYSFLKGCGKVCKEDYSKLNAEFKRVPWLQDDDPLLSKAEAFH